MLLDSNSGSDGHQDMNVNGAREGAERGIKEIFKITILFFADFTYRCINN